MKLNQLNVLCLKLYMNRFLNVRMHGQFDKNFEPTVPRSSFVGLVIMTFTQKHLLVSHFSLVFLYAGFHVKDHTTVGLDIWMFGRFMSRMIIWWYYSFLYPSILHFSTCAMSILGEWKSSVNIVYPFSAGTIFIRPEMVPELKDNTYNNRRPIT